MQGNTKDDMLAKIAEAIRTRFMSQRAMHLRILDVASSASDNVSSLHPAWDGGQDSRGAMHKPVWPKLARFALDKSIDPVHWVDALFSMTYLFSHPVRPNDLQNPQVLKKVKDWWYEKSLDREHAMTTQLINMLGCQWSRRMGTSLSEEAVARTVIVDPRLDAPAIVRYVIALHYGHKDLAKKLQVDAIRQYLVDPSVCDRVLAEFLPESFKALAIRVVKESSTSGS